jgi:hypothetical protein
MHTILKYLIYHLLGLPIITANNFIKSRLLSKIRYVRMTNTLTKTIAIIRMVMIIEVS